MLGQVPPPAEPAPFSPPPHHRLRLSNGVEALLCECPTVPMINLSWVAPAGFQCDPPGLAGVSALTAPLIKRGTRRRDARKLAADLEDLGTDMLSSVDWDIAHLAIEVLAGDLDRGVEVLGELVAAPVFPREALAVRVRQHLHQLQRSRQSTAALAEEVFHRVVYRGTVYARSRLGTPESLARIDRGHLAEFHQRHFALGAGQLVAVGSFQTEEMINRLEASFPAAGPEVAPEPPVIEPRVPAARRIVVVDVPKAPQTELRLGHAGISAAHPDFDRLQVLNGILGGVFGSRLNRSLRERRGLTYGVTSQFVARGGPGPFVVSAAVDTGRVAEAVTEMVDQMERLRHEEVPGTELESVRKYLLGVYPQRFQAHHGISLELIRWVGRGVSPEAGIQCCLRDFRETSPEDLRRLAQHHIRPAELTLVACGPAERLREPLSSLGDVVVFAPDDLTNTDSENTDTGTDSSQIDTGFDL